MEKLNFSIDVKFYDELSLSSELLALFCVVDVISPHV